MKLLNAHPHQEPICDQKNKTKDAKLEKKLKSPRILIRQFELRKLYIILFWLNLKITFIENVTL